jgi:hypothetical protein
MAIVRRQRMLLASRYGQKTTLLFVALLLWSCCARAASVCYEDRLKISDAQRKGCQAHEVGFRTNEGLVRAQLAQVIVGNRKYGDYLPALYHYFLRLPNNSILPLGEFLPWENVVPENRWTTDLGFRIGIKRAAVHTKTGPSRWYLVFDPVIEKNEAGAYCLVYHFKAPFIGELRDCVGRYSEPDGRVGYVAGTVRIDEAWRLACAHAVSGTSRKCQTNDVSENWTVLRREADQSLHYIVVLRREGTPTNWTDWLIYRVRANGAAVDLVERSFDLVDLDSRYGAH